MPNRSVSLAICLLSILLCSCGRQISPDVYSEKHVGEASRSFRGVVIAARDVKVEGKEKLEENTAGLATGGVAGGLIGNQFGGGSGNIAAIAAGAIAGAVAGGFIQKELETQNAVEYTVELSNHEVRTVVQSPAPRFSVGQRVMVMISYNGRSRVVADNTAPY